MLLADGPDLIAYHGKIVTVDAKFTVAEAVAVKDGKIVAVGSDEAVVATKGAATTLIDLDGRTVLPGLIDSHVHPGAAMTEFDHEIPEMESIADVLAYVRTRAAAVGEGKWVEVSQVFITRLKEQRYPTRAELDEAAPKNPVVFSTGPDASLNTLAMKLSGIDKGFKVDDGGPGFAETDPATGEPTGVLRGCTRYVKAEPAERKPAEEDTYRRTLELFKDYNANGLTCCLRPFRRAGRHRPLREDARRHGDPLTIRTTAPSPSTSPRSVRWSRSRSTSVPSPPAPCARTIRCFA